MQPAGRDHFFEAFLRGAHAGLHRRYGRAFANEVVDAAREKYERVRLEVPDIGGRHNVFQPVMTINGWLAALHLAMRAHGRDAEDTIRVSQEVIDGWLRALPGFVLRGLGRLALSAPMRWYFERQALQSQQRRFAEDFVWHVERAPDGEFLFVFDECAVHKWYNSHDLHDLKPYCNFADITYGRLMAMGVDATHTIGLGCEQCALRFKLGRPTEVPDNLEGIITQE